MILLNFSHEPHGAWLVLLPFTVLLFFAEIQVGKKMFHIANLVSLVLHFIT